MPTLELTDKFCQSAKPIDGRQTDYFDTIVKGLCLRVSPAGTRAWTLHYTKPGTRQRARVKLGRYPEIPLGGDKGARQKAKDTRAKVHDGADPVADRKAQEAAQTVADLIDNYVARHASTKRSGDEIARRLRKNVADVIGTIRLADLHRRDLTRCIDKIKDRGAGTEANKVFEDVRAMIRWARGRGDLDQNLTEGMRLPTETVERDRVLSAEDIRIMWTALPDADMRESTRRVIRLCLVTSQRVGEVAGMTLDELDLNNAVWTIPAARSKKAAIRKLPIRPDMKPHVAGAAKEMKHMASWPKFAPARGASGGAREMAKILSHLEKASAVLDDLSTEARSALTEQGDAIHFEASQLWAGGHSDTDTGIAVRELVKRVRAAKEYLEAQQEQGAAKIIGRPRDDYARNATEAAMVMYEAMTGKRATVITDPHKPGYPRSGEFLDFLTEVLKVFGSPASPQSQAKAVLAEPIDDPDFDRAAFIEEVRRDIKERSQR